MAKIFILLAYRFKAYLYFFIDLIKANLRILKNPYKLTYVVTKKCNSKCLNCSIWKKKNHNDLNLKQIETIAKQMKYLKWIDFTGGEVTLRNDFSDIIETFVNSCPQLLYVHFPTNGIQTEKIVEIAKRCLHQGKYKLVITVSIDGPEQINDHLRGINGDFNLAINTYKELKKIKGVDVYIGTTVYQSNIDYLEQLYISLEKNVEGFSYKDLHINLGHYSAHYYNNSQSSDIKHSKEIQKKITSFINQKKTISIAPLSIINRFYRNKMTKFLLNGKTPIPCRSGRSTVYISEEGELYPCSMWDHAIGNLKENTYFQLQKSDGFKKALHLIDQKKCANCWTPCEAYPSILDQLIRL